MKKIFYKLEDANELPIQMIGGKAKGLAELIAYGFNVPKGGVLTTEAFEVSKEERIQSVIEGLKSLGIQNEQFAVRSSATKEDGIFYSFAGIHNSYLNVKIENLSDAIDRCYKSLHSERAKAYHQKHGIAESDVLMAVVIMQMIDPDQSGIAFSNDPVTGRRNICVINAARGLGDKIVSGEIQPDQYVVDHGSIDYEIISKELVNKNDPVLNDQAIRDLTVQVSRIEETLGNFDTPMDIEWAIKDLEHFFLQARPVTNQATYLPVPIQGQPYFFTSSNVKDAVPMVLPHSLYKFIGRMSEMIMTGTYDVTGYNYMKGLDRFKVIEGHLYMNGTLLEWELHDAYGTPPEVTMESIGGHHKSYGPPKKEKPAIKFGRAIRGLKLLRCIWNLDRDAQINFSFVQNWIKELERRCEGDVSRSEMKELLIKNQKIAMNFGKFEALLNSAPGGFTMIAKQFLKKDEALIAQLIQGSGIFASAEQGYRLMELAEKVKENPTLIPLIEALARDGRKWEEILPREFRQFFKQYLNDFGHRSVEESNILVPRWNEDPTYLFQSILAFLESSPLSVLREKQKKNKVEAEKIIDKKFDPVTRKLIRYFVKKAARGAELREQGKNELLRFNHGSRVALLKCAHEMIEQGAITDPNDVFFLTQNEVHLWCEYKLQAKDIKFVIPKRKAQYEYHRSLIYHDVIKVEGNKSTKIDMANVKLSGDVLKGISVSSGIYRGKIRKITHPHDGMKLNAGEILLAPSTDPGWTPLFLRAGGIIMETGGYLSHGAIVAREFGLPAVVNIPGIMNSLTDGTEVIVDGSSGTVRIIS